MPGAVGSVQPRAEEMNQERLSRVAGHRHGCRHGDVSFVPMMGNGDGTSSPGRPTAAPLTATPPLSAAEARMVETTSGWVVAA